MFPSAPTVAQELFKAGVKTNQQKMFEEQSAANDGNKSFATSKCGGFLYVKYRYSIQTFSLLGQEITCCRLTSNTRLFEG